MMNKRRLGHSDLMVSEIGLGCMNLGTDSHHARNIINTALEYGINYLDTADLYDFGENEKIVGEAIKGNRDKVIIATKGGNHFKPGEDGWFWDPSKAYLKEAFKNSLLRLGVDEIDLYQLHGGTIEDPTDEVIEMFEELQQEGLIRYYGISSIRPNVIKAFLQNSSMTSVMMQYSLLDRRPEEEMLDLLVEHDVGVVVRGALGKGMLTEKGLRQWNKKGQNGYLDYSSDELKQTIQSIQNLADEHHVSPQTLAISYTLEHPAVSSLILGSSHPDQLRENIKAYEESLHVPSLKHSLGQLTKANIYNQHRE